MMPEAICPIMPPQRVSNTWGSLSCITVVKDQQHLKLFLYHATCIQNYQRRWTTNLWWPFATAWSGHTGMKILFQCTQQSLIVSFSSPAKTLNLGIINHCIGFLANLPECIITQFQCSFSIHSHVNQSRISALPRIILPKKAHDGFGRIGSIGLLLLFCLTFLTRKNAAKSRNDWRFFFCWVSTIWRVKSSGQEQVHWTHGNLGAHICKSNITIPMLTPDRLRHNTLDCSY